MITTHPIRFVSLGPGEPDLITLKGLKALQGADCIFCPATMTQDGKSSSRALSILNTLGFSDTVQCFRLPMDKDRTLALRSYEAVYESSKILRAEGQNVVIVAEGDAGLYSSIHYIYDKLQQDDIPVEQIAGIPAFIASGAMAGLHIVSQEERLIVIPGHVTAKELDDYLKHQTVVVIMNLSQCIDEVHQCIINHPEYQYHYFENVGTEKEYYSCSTEELREKRYPYFSVMIIRFG